MILRKEWHFCLPLWVGAQISWPKEESVFFIFPAASRLFQSPISFQLRSQYYWDNIFLNHSYLHFSYHFVYVFKNCTTHLRTQAHPTSSFLMTDLETLFKKNKHSLVELSQYPQHLPQDVPITSFSTVFSSVEKIFFKANWVFFSLVPIFSCFFWQVVSSISYLYFGFPYFLQMLNLSHSKLTPFFTLILAPVII